MPWFSFEANRTLNQPQKIVLDQFKFLFIETEQGPKAYDLYCPHEKALLSTGEVDNGELECLYHGWKFRLDNGECTFPEGACALTCFEVRESEVGLEVLQPE